MTPLEEHDGKAIIDLTIRLAKLDKEHPNLENVLKAAYSLLIEIKSTMPTSRSDETMVSTQTQEVDRLLLELAELKVDISAMLEDKFSELNRKFGEEKVSALLPFDSEIRY